MRARTSGAILITGAAGFIGSHMVQRLAEGGQRLLCLDSFDPYYPAALKEANLRETMVDTEHCFVRGDVRDRRLLEGLFSDHPIETVLHLAARPGVRASLEDPVPYFDINVTGTLALLEVCRSFGVKRFVFASSSSVYGESGGSAASEEATPCRPLSPYGTSKVAMELLCQSYSRLCDMTMLGLRFFTVYGPRQRPDMAIRRFADLIDAGEEIAVFGDGRSRRDYTYISDIVSGVEASLSLSSSGYQVFNLGGSRPVELNTVIDLLERNLGKKARVRFEQPLSAEPKFTFADTSKAERELAFEATVGIEEGIARFVAWRRGRTDAFAKAV